jgi:hypothetical protein
MSTSKSKYSCVEMSDSIVVKNIETGQVLANLTPTGIMTQGVLQIKNNTITGITVATGAETHSIPTLSKIQETIAAIPTTSIVALDTIAVGDTNHVSTTNKMSEVLAALPTASVVAIDTIAVGDTHHVSTTNKVTEVLAALPTASVVAIDTHGLGDTMHVPTTDEVQDMIDTTLLTSTKEINLMAGVRFFSGPSATHAAIGNFQIWDFKGNADNEIGMTLDVPHDYTLGTPIEVHVHWFAEDNTAGNIDWSLSYNIATVTGVFDVTGTTAPTVSVANSATTYKHVTTVLIAALDMSSVVADGACVQFRLQRLGSADTYNKGAYVVSVGCHYQASS